MTGVLIALLVMGICTSCWAEVLDVGLDALLSVSPGEFGCRELVGSWFRNVGVDLVDIF